MNVYNHQLWPTDSVATTDRKLPSHAQTTATRPEHRETQKRIQQQRYKHFGVMCLTNTASYARTSFQSLKIKQFSSNFDDIRSAKTHVVHMKELS